MFKVFAISLSVRPLLPRSSTKYLYAILFVVDSLYRVIDSLFESGI